MPAPPADFDALFDGDLCTDRELDSVFSSALTLTTLADAGTARAHVSAWATSLAPRLIERWTPALVSLTPDESSFAAALGGKPREYEAQLLTLSARAEGLRERAEEADVEGQRGLGQASGAALALLRQRTRPPELEETSLLDRLLAFLQGIATPPEAPRLPDLTSLPEELRRAVRTSAGEYLRAEVLHACADQLDGLGATARRRLEQNQQGIDTLARARTKIRGEVTNRRDAFAPLAERLLQDLSADDGDAIQRMVARARRVDLGGLVREQGARLDEGTAERELRLAVADEVRRLAQQPFSVLLPELAGTRTLRDAVEPFVRDCAPLAPLDRGELTGRERYDGVSIASVETHDPILRAALLDALKRVGDVAVEPTGQVRLPPGVAARIVRYAGVLPSETMSRALFELMRTIGAPAELEEDKARDWVDDEDMRPLVSQERLHEEIARLRRRGESTFALEAWVLGLEAVAK